MPPQEVPAPIERVLEESQVTRNETVIEIPADEWDPEAAEAHDTRLFVAVVVRNDDELLFVRNQWSPEWIVPGGSVEPGESLEAAARREVREETGVACEVERPVHVTRQVFRHAGDPDRSETGFLVVFEARATDPALAEDPGVAGETIHDVGWFDEVPVECRNPALVGEYLG